ncbi:hypothetical protein AB751O23_AB_00440 [Chlamydiales bacterium SCGC AB-751-O23]|jgi:hypothetical protein|nr:hypothetical protein AB751O23_AB_00440 [Chlamydiales bacterium SCGC AB-751-O23]
MANYYFLNTLFASIELGHPPEEGVLDLLPNVEEQLTSKDLKSLLQLRLYFDIQNLKAYFQKEPLSPFANFQTHELIESYLEHREGFPDFVFKFLDEFDSNEQRIANFADLLRQFFDYIAQVSTGFVRSFFDFERKWRIVMVGFRSKNLNLDVQKQLQFENPYDSVVAQVVAQKDAKSFEPPIEFSELKNIVSRWKQSPKGILKALEQYRFDKIDDLIEGDFFSFDAVAAYLLKLVIVEQWHNLELGEKEGSENLEKILEDIE